MAKPIIIEEGPMYSPSSYGRQSLDSRLAKKFSRQATIDPAVRTRLLRQISQSKWTPKERAIFGAVAAGYETTEELVIVAGLTAAQISPVLSKLQSSGALRSL